MKIRIGKDIKIRWGVTIEGEVADPAVYDLTLELRDSFGSAVEIAQPTLVDGLLETTFYGKDHKRTGSYRLTLWLNKGKKGQSVVDACEAFTLVACSCQEEHEEGEITPPTIQDEVLVFVDNAEFRDESLVVDSANIEGETLIIR